MKTNFCGLIILTITSLIFSTRIYKEDAVNIQKRMKYLKTNFEEVTQGALDVEFGHDTGIICVAKKDLEPYETLFNVDKKYIVSFCN